MERITANTQHLDLEGTVAADNSDKPPLFLGMLRDMAAAQGHPELFPVGVRIYAHPDSSEDVTPVLYCADPEAVGRSADDVERYARTHSEIPVVQIEMESVKWHLLLAKLKRLDIVFGSQLLKGKPMCLAEPAEV